MEFLRQFGNDFQLSFLDLQKFILTDMRMQKNYQPIMLRTLLENGGKASKEEILKHIKESNLNNHFSSKENV